MYLYTSLGIERVEYNFSAKNRIDRIMNNDRIVVLECRLSFFLLTTFQP